MFDRALWGHKFAEWPTWPCPACYSVALSVQKPDNKVLNEETGPSKQAHDHDAWEPDWTRGKFATLLQCHNPACGELVSAVGNVSVEDSYDYDHLGEPERTCDDVFEPTYFDSAPPIFKIPEACPDAVAIQLKAAFGLIWCDVGAAANRLRAGIEVLLDERHIAKTAKSGKKRVPLTTHRRIEKLATSDADAAKYLMAIKWLGNSGSHGTGGNLGREDVLNGMELFEAAIDKLYVKSAEKFATLAAAISKRKGKPVKKVKKKKKP